MYKTVKLNIDNKIATITLNRPEELNALNYDMIDELQECLDKCEKADSGGYRTEP